MSEQQVMEIRFPGERLGAYTDDIGVTWTLFYMDYPYECYAIHGSDDDGAWLEDSCGKGLAEAEIRQGWPELADAAGLD